MGRMHSRGKGKSRSCIPYKRTPPSWVKADASQITETIVKLARKGYMPSQIGNILRDQHGIPHMRYITKNKIVRILKMNGMAPEIPEPLYYLIKKAVQMRKHLEKFRKDVNSKFRLILVESRIYRIARYYKTCRKLPPKWKYKAATASTLVS